MGRRSFQVCCVVFLFLKDTCALPSDVHCRLISNTYADCSHSGLSFIPNQTFPEHLKSLDLSFNNIHKVDGFTFHRLLDLEWLNLSQNDINKLNKHAFYNLTKLKYLNLNSNRLLLESSTYPLSLFQPIQSLQILHLEDNICHQKMKSDLYPPGIAGLSKLQELYTDFPPFVVFPKTIYKMTNLKVLSSSGFSIPHKKNRGCCVKGMYNNTFPNSGVMYIKHFRLSHSCISELHINALSALQNLDRFEWIGNQRGGLYRPLQAFYGLQNANISYISLRGNNDFTMRRKKGFILDRYLMRYLKTVCASHLDISQNYIILPGRIRLTRPECLRFVDISGHSSDVHRLFLNFINAQIFPNLAWFNMSNYIGASGPDILPADKSSISSTNNTLLPLTNLDLSYLPMQCAFYSKQFSTVQVMNLTGWNCSRLQPDLFLNMWNVTSLTIRKAGLRTGLKIHHSKGSFLRNLNSLEFLDISENDLSYLPNDLLLNNNRLRSLILFNNKFSSLPTTVFQKTELVFLDLSSNAVHWFTSDEIHILNNQKEKFPKFTILLNSNTFLCSCVSVDFLQWLNTTTIVADIDSGFTCRYQNGSEIAIKDFMIDFRNFSVGCISESWLKTSIAAVVVFLLLIITGVFYCRRRWNIHYWFYTNCKPTEDMLPKTEYAYDAFVAYNHNDTDWVYNNLRKMLEDEGCGLKLCLHHRDFEAGEVIQQNIVDSINRSRKIILVISQQFIRSTWGEYEIQMAAMRSVQEARSNVIVCVLLEEVPIKDMPKSLMNLWNRVTFLVWPENNFWERMKNTLI